MKNAVFWDVAPCRSCLNRRFGVTYRLHLQGRKIRERGTSLRRPLHPRSTLSHIPEDGILQWPFIQPVICRLRDKLSVSCTTQRRIIWWPCIMNWKGRRRKRSWPYLRHYLGVCLEGFRKNRNASVRLIGALLKIWTETQWTCSDVETEPTSRDKLNFIYLSMALQPFCWTLAAFSVSSPYTQSAGLLGRIISTSQGRYLRTE
jgi:hypothetical protein